MHVHMIECIIDNVCGHVCMCVCGCVCVLVCVCSHVWGVWVMPIKLGSCIGGLIHVDPTIRDDGW